MQNANEDELRFGRHVIEGVIALENHAQARDERLARRSQKRKLQQSPARVRDLGEQARRYRLGGFGGNVRPNFGKVGFRRLG